nr:hypothetical protein [Treponema sp.]
MKNKIARIAIILNLTVMAVLLLLCFVGKAVGFESDVFTYIAFALILLGIVIPPVVIAILYLLGSEAANDYVFLSVAAAFVFNLIIAIPNNFSGWHIF